MAVTVVASAAAKSTNLTDANGLTINKPTGTASGDFLVAILSAPYTGSVNWTPPSGWTLAASDHHSSVSLESRVYTLTAGGSEPSSYSWATTFGGGSYAGVIVTFRGTTGLVSVTGSNPKDTVASTTNPVTEPGTTSPVWPGLGVYAVSWHAAGSTGMSCVGNIGTEQGDQSTTDGSPSTHERGCAVYTHGVAHSAGSYGSTGVATMSSAPTASIVWTIDLADAGAMKVASTMPRFGSDWLASRVVRVSPWASTMPRFTSDIEVSSTVGAVGSTMPRFGSHFEASRFGLKVELLIGATWTDVTESLRYNDAVSVSNGRQSSGDTLTTAMAHFTLDNRDDSFSLRNAVGPYYGLIGRNTQCRITKLETGYRFWGEVSAWTPGADDTGNDRYVKIEASGITRRLGASKSSIQPAIQREIMANSPLAYWPCNESSGSFASPITGVRNMQVAGSPDYGDYNRMACSDPFPQLNTSSWYTPTIAGTSMTNGITTAFLLASPGGITNGTRMARVNFEYAPTAFVRPWAELQYSGTNELTLAVFDLAHSAGSIVGTVPIVGANGVLVYMAFGIDGSGHIKFGLWYQGEDNATPVLVGTSSWVPPAGDAVGENISLSFNPSNVDLSQNSAAYIGQVAVWNGYSPASTLQYASVGAYSGEAAGTRFVRICTEEGITATVNNASNSSLMGAQLPKSVLDLLKECEATDLGIMYEARDSFGLGYIVRRDLYNQDVALELDYSAGDLSSQLQPTYDDKDVENDVTVQRNGGSSARYVVNANSTLSTQDPPNGVGVYASPVTVSLAKDSQCYPQAGWRAHLGTVDEERITSVGVAIENPRFANNFSFQEEAYAVAPGSRIKVVNPPDWAGEVDQIVQGYSERFDNQTHDITFNTNPASPYDIAVVGSCKADSLTSTLSTSANSSTTSLSVAVTGVLWRTGTVNFDILVGGEQMTVTAVSGSSSPQTFTVTRSVNGIVKSHSTGEQVRLYTPAIVGL